MAFSMRASHLQGNVAVASPVADSLSDEPMICADPMPSFNDGGLKAFQEWVQKQLTYPDEAIARGIWGRVTVGFVIERDGFVTNTEVLASPDSLLSEAVLRVVRLSPRWAPGRIDAHPVRVRLSIPIDFDLKLIAEEQALKAGLPTFMGGDLSKFKRWVLQNIEFSETIFNLEDEGWVDVSFTVSSKGKVRNVETPRYTDEDFAREVRRTVASSPLWTPGENPHYVLQMRFNLLLKRNANGLYTEDNTAYTDADVLPTFCGGGAPEFREWIYRKVDSLLGPSYATPDVPIYLRFVVERDGTLTDITVNRPTGKTGFAKLVRRAVDEVPLWTPAEINGEKVRFQVSQALGFGPKPATGDDELYSVAEEMPKFQQGGLDAFRTWVRDNMNCPEVVRKKGTSGRLEIAFVVERDGSVSSMRILESPHPLLSAEIVETLGRSPRWTPGMQGGVPVRVKYTLSLDFPL